MFVRYMEAEAEREMVMRSFMAYVTDSLRLQGQGMYRADRWAESALGVRRESWTAEDVVARLGESGAFEVM